MRKSTSIQKGRVCSAVVASALLVATAPLQAAEHLNGTQRQQQRGYSPGVVTEGGRFV